MEKKSESAVESLDNTQWKVDKVRALHTLNSHSEVENVYDEFADTIDELVTSLEYCGPAYTADVITRIEPNHAAKILDVGCGTGLVGEKLHKAGYHKLYGVDLSSTSLQVLEKKGIYSNLIHANFGPNNPLDFADGYFDLALSCGCFLPMHLNEKCLPEMIRLVKPDGYLVITTRKYIFDAETRDMKLKSGLLDLTREGALVKVRHEESLYEKDGEENVVGITLIYQVVKKSTS